MLDNNHRSINYLRLSVTDRCNLRCIYCMPEEGIQFLPHDEILSYEEMLHVVRLCVQSGIRKVRLTGGEPLVRKGILSFIEKLCRTEGLEEISLTTNGVLLKDMARDLKRCGICRINISMDSLKEEKFSKITRRDFYREVWEGIDEAQRVGFSPIKLNVVAMKGVNDDEILDFARLTLKKPYHVRFIEMMPVGEKNAWTSDTFLSTREILGKIRSLGSLKPVGTGPLDGPAQRYILEGALGEIGLIGALSHHFCETCNRLRLTADGHLRGCLFSDRERDIKTPLRENKGDDCALDIIRETIMNKPKDHGMNVNKPKKCVRSMNSIGG
ncbi:MAG: GTP 3',8-cyclase MoaA [Deltaproteobacteria bacterium]|nr:GTP 3',8-cyclase MoaA [Deltaproteobacteria bacterium]